MEGIGIDSEELGQLGSEIDGVGLILFSSHNTAATLFELGNGCAPDTLGVVGGLGNSGKRAYPVFPEGVSRVDSHLDIADLRSEYVVSGVGDIRVACQTGEENDAVSLRQRSDSEHCAAA